MSSRATWIVQILFVIALAGIAALIQRGQVLGIDEIEFFRATRWISEGRVPYRDFWEHHTPLQWFLFAPVARLAPGPGAGPIVLMRWVQVVLWIAIFVVLMRLARRSGVEPWGRWMAPLFLLSSFSFGRKALEYRVDVPGNLAYVGAVALVAFGGGRWEWIGFGALMSVSALANMRLAPLAVLTAVVLLFWRAEDRVWRFNPRALWMFAGVASVAAVSLAYFAASGAMPFLGDCLYRYNVAPGRQPLETSTPLQALLSPIIALDPSGVIFWIAGLTGCVLAFRDIRRPGPLQILSIAVVFSVLTVWQLEMQYEYHFHTALLLMLPLAGMAAGRLESQWRKLAIVVAALSLFVSAVRIAKWPFGAEMSYQDSIMREADRRTLPGERVWDGVGYATRREPAYRYWFLPLGVIVMAAEHLIPPYDGTQIAANPPAAVIADFRVFRWFGAFPGAARYVTTHYVPLTRHVWIPGMSALIGRQPVRIVWRAPRAGTYHVWASDLLPYHPWFTRPLDYGATPAEQAAKFEIPLRRLPPYRAASLQWRIGGVALPRDVQTFTVGRGDVVELTARAPERVGLFLIPDGVDTLFTAPETHFTF